ncbi:hypothetical protein [Bradyrhizobium liaoningense]|uniref:hypothetical protein n=1 Tax=Bradyrhizobium liaoningense TaxID=43992 RepID=UPI001BA74630|nr:hypothetical protein [Bradyrhizobium liaoningense]MBR0855442.1 hypothetical protein [Bradyrhizobium liaoningense]
MNAVTVTSTWFGYVRKTPAEIETLAWEILDGKIFGTWDIPADHEPQLIFLALLGIDPLLAAELERQDVTNCYNHLAASGPRTIEGLPIFVDHYWLDRHDADLVQARIEELAAALKQRDEAQS